MRNKLMLFTLKILPAIMAFSYLFNVICVYFQVPFQLVTHYLGIVIAPLLFIYLASYVFKFCEYHRWYIHYIAIVELLNITDYYFHIPISNKAICIVHFAITAIFLIGALIFYIVKYKIKSRPRKLI